MKKIQFLFLFVFGLLVASPAFALQCKDGNYGSDECWTEVSVSSLETSPVSIGTILVYDFNAGTAEDGAFQTVVSSASTDGYRVAGVAQKVIATGDRGRVLVRGKGKLRVQNTVSSGDRLFAAGPLRGLAGLQGPAGAAASHDPVIAFSLQSSTGAQATIDAFITVV